MATKSKAPVSRAKKSTKSTVRFGASPVKKYLPIIAIVLFAVVGTTLLTLSFAARGGKNGNTTVTSTPTTTLGSVAEIVSLHNTLCPKVALFSNCTTMGVKTPTVEAGWLAYSHPADNYVEYNAKYLSSSVATWSNAVAHEVGGHMDTWNEMVAKVGASRAWTDYYDIDKFAEPFFEKKLAKDLTLTISKEIYLDCQGSVRNGYAGSYLRMQGKTTLADQQATCSGYRTIFDQAIAS